MKTLNCLFDDCVKKYKNNVFLLEKRNNKYKGSTYQEVQEKVYQFGAGLISLGINNKDHIALLSEGRNNWVIGELGILYAGAVNVPLSTRLEDPSEIKFRLEHSEAKMIIVSENQLGKLSTIKSGLKNLKYIVLLDKKDKLEKGEIYFSDIQKEGEKFLRKNRDTFEERWKSVEEKDYANICYTSGTTADPKGIMLTHRNYTANVEQSLSRFSIPDWWTTLLFLPWDHAFAHTCGIYTLMSCGASMAAVHIGKTPTETLKNFPVNIKEIRPNFLLSVPAISKNFKKNIEKGISEKGKTVERLFNIGLKIGILHNGNGWNSGKGFRFFLKPLYWIFKKIIFSKIKANFGGRLEFFVGGGALLDMELQKFFFAIGIPVFQGYGLTEASPVISSNNQKTHKMGSSGQLVDNLILKICDEDGNEVPHGEKGEIVIKGENVMDCYWKNPEATNDTIKDGWLYTGDMGYLDKNGFLYVLGRFKSLLIGDDGEKYSPEGIEEALISHIKYVDQCMLYNNQNNYTIALMSINKDAINKWAKEHDVDTHLQIGLESILHMLETEINQFRKEGKYASLFPQKWLPASVGIIPEPFSQENYQLNSTMKMVRDKISSHYYDLIQDLYTPQYKNICNKRNVDVLGNLLC